MATRVEVFAVLAAASGPLSREQLGEQVGQPVREWQKQLKGWIDNGLIEDTGDQHYVITEKGRKETLPEDYEGLDGEGLKAVRELAQDSRTMTDREKFIQLGIDAGMTNKGFLKGTANLVWNRGDPRDLDSVWAGLKEANIDRDIASRWFNFWTAHIRKSVPINVARELSYNIGSKDKSDKEKTCLSHNIDEDGNPVYVGEGIGALTHDEAFELAKIKAGQGRGGQYKLKAESPGDSLAAKAVDKVIGDMNQPPGTPVDETARLLTQVKALNELLGLGDKPNSADELARFITLFKSVQEITRDNKPATNSNPVRQLLVDKQTGEVKELAPGQPLVIIRESTPVSQATPIQVTDKDGNPIVLDIATFIKLEEHREKQRQDQDSHETKMEIAKGFKDLLNKAGKALTHMAEEEKE